MPHRRILFVNPPLIGDVAFTRQGRCQEREEVLGTTKPPYTLALLAALFRNEGHGAPLVCFGPHASTAPDESMGRASEVDAMIVGEPEDTLLALSAMKPGDA